MSNKNSLEKIIHQGKLFTGEVLSGNIIRQGKYCRYQDKIPSPYPDEYSPDNHKNSKTFVQCLCW